MKSRILLLIVTIAIAIGSMVMPSAGMASSSQFSVGYCTKYAAQRFDTVVPSPGVNWYGNANAWYDAAIANQWVGTQNISAPKINSIVVWTGGKDGFGHVAFIESVSSTGISIAEMNVTGLGQVSRATLTWAQIKARFNNEYKVYFKGYILPERSIPPAAPTGLTAIAISRNQIKLSWIPPKYVAGYIVERQNIFGGWQQIVKYNTNFCSATITPSSYVDSFLIPNTCYCYRVRAFYNLVGSPSSVCIRTQP